MKSFFYKSCTFQRGFRPRRNDLLDTPSSPQQAVGYPGKVQDKGFTLVELLLVIGIIGIIVGLAIPFYQNYQISTQLDTNSFQLVQTLRKAQSQAMASQDYQTFGVRFEPRKFVLFKGASYNPSDQNNEVYELPSSLSLMTNSPQILFSRVKGLPTLSGPSPVPTTTLSVTLRSNNNQVKIINVNEVGKVDLL